jgi:hypothetical protein
MKLNRFGTVLTSAEERSLRAWSWYTLLSTAIIVGYILYTVAHSWYLHYNKYEHLRAEPEVQTQLTTVLQEKGTLKKELEELNKKHGELARIRQQTNNPYRLLQAMQELFAGRTHLLSYTGEGAQIQFTLMAPDRTAFDQIMQQSASSADTRQVELQSMQLLTDGAVQATLSAHL